MKNLFSSISRSLFLQTTIAIVLGSLVGISLLIFVGRTFDSAKASQSNQSSGNSFLSMDKLPGWPTLTHPMTLLIMGVDSNGAGCERFVGTRSDTMILAKFDPATHKVGLISIPRDSRVKIAGKHPVDKINSAHAYGGPALAMATISETFGIPVDHYVVVDTQGLKQLCNLIGPVEVLVEKEMHYTDHTAKLNVDLKPGWQVLTPAEAEQYIRFRHDAKADIGRIERQQWFLRQATQKLKDPELVLHLPDILKLAYNSIQTDLSLDDMASLAIFAKGLDTREILTSTLPGKPEMINGGSYWIPDPIACQTVFSRLFGVSTLSAATTISDINAVNEAAAAAITNESAAHRPISVALKYAKGSEQTADQLDTLLTTCGYKVRYKWLASSDECQHEQIVINSRRADDNSTANLKRDIPDLSRWPIALSIETHPTQDFTIVVSPATSLLTASNVSTDKAHL